MPLKQPVDSKNALYGTVCYLYGTSGPLVWSMIDFNKSSVGSIDKTVFDWLILSHSMTMGSSVPPMEPLIHSLVVVTISCLPAPHRETSRTTTISHPAALTTSPTSSTLSSTKGVERSTVSQVLICRSQVLICRSHVLIYRSQVT